MKNKKSNKSDMSQQMTDETQKKTVEPEKKSGKRQK